MSVQRFDELVAEAARASGVDHETARALILSWFDVSRDALFAEKSQTLPGIGTLHLKYREAYTITNPRTGERQAVEARYQMKFAEHAEMVRHFSEHHGIPVTKAWLAAHPKEQAPAEPRRPLTAPPRNLILPAEEEPAEEDTPVSNEDGEPEEVASAEGDLGETPGSQSEAGASTGNTPAVPSTQTNPRPAARRKTREATMMPPIPPSKKPAAGPTAPVPGPEFSRKALSRWVGKLPPSQVPAPVEASVVEASQPGVSRGRKAARPAEGEVAHEPEVAKKPAAQAPEPASEKAPAPEPEGDPRLRAAEAAILENLEQAMPSSRNEGAASTPAADETAAPAAEEVLLSRPAKAPRAFPVRAMVEGLIVGLVLAVVIVGVWLSWPWIKRTTQPEVVTIRLQSGQEGRPELPLVAGDTLPDLAEKIWGDRRLWVALYDANRTRIADPDRLQPGRDRLFVPLRPAGSLAESYLRLRETRPFDGPARQWERLLTAWSLDPDWVAREKHRLTVEERRTLNLP